MDYKKIIIDIMNNIDTIRKEKTTPEFFEYAKGVHIHLATMKPHEHFNIEQNVKHATTNDFMKAVALYIVGFGGIFFSEDYKLIIKGS